MECESDGSSDSEYWSESEHEEVQEIREGATFRTAPEAVEAVRDYALREGKSVKVPRHSGADRRIVCTSAPTCGFFVQLYRRSRSVEGRREWLHWYISSLNLEHHDCISRAKPTEKQIAKLAGFAATLRTNSAVKAKSIIEQMQETNGVALGRMKRKVYRAMERVREQSDDEALRSFGMIDPYLEAFRSVNPGTFTVVEKDPESRFRRAAVVVGPSVKGVIACQRIVGVDCSHSKSKHFSGVQVHLVGRDGNFKNITVAFGLVPAEDNESYGWFLDLVEGAGYDLSELPVFCDRNNALLSTATSRNLHLRYCTLHIIRNVAHKFGKLSKADRNLVWAVQGAETEEGYRSKLEIIRIALGDAARSYLASIPAINWCLFANIHKKALYGWRTSNFVESVFGTQLVTGMRRLHPYEFVKKLCEKLLDDFYTRATNAAEWKARGALITPGAMSRFNQQATNLGNYEIMKSNSDEAYVVNVRSFPRLMRRVCFSKNDCSCGYIDQYGIPCRHLIAALAEYDREDEAPHFFHDYYKVDKYEEGFGRACIRLPLEQELQRDASCLPPLVVKRAGRRKQKRFRSNGEDSLN